MNILFTILYVDGFHGSVQHVQELAEFFLSQNKNNKVYISTLFYTEEHKNILTNKGIKLNTIDTFEDNILYDIVFAFHYPIIDTLIRRGLKCNKLILGSLSEILEIEAYPSYWNKASLLTVMSFNTAKKHNKNYNIPLEKMYIFENPIPDKFAIYNLNRKLPSLYPKKIAVISNHIPTEILELSKELSKSIKIDYIGMGGGKYIEVTPNILSTYDLIITIGKTVQYAMGMGIPVYEYDHFGGNGYITPENIADEAISNFSGRNKMRKLSAREIAKEILEGYRTAILDIEQLKKIAIDRFLLSTNMNKLLDIIERSPYFNKEKVNEIYSLELAHSESFCQYIKSYRPCVEELCYLKKHFFKYIINKCKSKICKFYKKILCVVGGGYKKE